MSTQIERALQSEVMTRLRAGPWPVIALPIPNGIWIPARSDAERALVPRIVARMKADGMLVPGAPDLAVFYPGGGGMIELKAPKTRTLLGTRPAGRPTESQTAIAERAAALGINHAFCCSWDEVSGTLRRWLGGAEP